MSLLKIKYQLIGVEDNRTILKPSPASTFIVYEADTFQKVSISLTQHQFNFQRIIFKFMRNSPINHIRNNRDITTSPYEARGRNQSPPRGSRDSPERNIGYPSADGEYWRQRSKQLETELIAVNEELLFQVRKNQKIEDLQQKIELLLDQNTHFVDENQNLIRLVQQKNSQIELWKKKFDGQFTHSNIAEAEKKKVFDHLNIKDQQHQIQIQKLLSEITRLQNQSAENQNLRKIQIHRLKNQYQNESINQIQNLKRSQHGNNQIQELNIRKLKDIIEEKNYQIENLRREMKIKSQELKAEISFNKNQTKKLEEQKTHQINLIKAENENVKSNLVRAHRKNEDQMKNLHQAKVKRLTYEVEEKKNEIQEAGARLKRTGKQAESELIRLSNENSSIRNQTKENDNRNRNQIRQLAQFYQKQFKQEVETAATRDANLSNFYEGEIKSLNSIIKAKQQEIQRILATNHGLKINEEARLRDIQSNNQELKKKIEQLINHYEREIELTKIKISSLYEADLEALRSEMRNSYANHTREAQNLRQLLKQTQAKMANQVQDKLDLRKDYELRLTQFKVKYEREHQQLNDLIALHEKQIDNHASKASLSHIEHNTVLQTRHLNMKQLMNQKRTLQAQIQNKNKQIESLNLRIQKMTGFHKRDIEKLEADLDHQKSEHQAWLSRQDRETSDSNAERAQLKATVEQLNNKLQAQKKKSQESEDSLRKSNQDKSLQISNLEGTIQEYQSKVGHLHSKHQVQVGNVQKTFLQTRSVMNVEKDKLLETTKKEKSLIQTETNRVRSELQEQIADLSHENEILQDNYRKAQIREEELKTEIRNLADSVNKRNKLQEHVINIGLSNNYFKNVAQIFKRTIEA